MSTSHEPPAQADGLRERHVGADSKGAGGAEGPTGLEKVEEVDKEQKTFGRTPDGTSTSSIFLKARLSLNLSENIMTRKNLANKGRCSLHSPSYP
jgi:hypothetical protein